MDEADELKDRFAGALIGLAVGDALGTTLEFSTRGSFEPINDMVGGGPFDLEAGQWTDDTSMALCLAESLVEDGFDPDSQMGKYIKWYMYGYLGSTGECFDIGNNTAKSLNHYRGTGEFPEEYEYAAGNGSLMRLAPVPMFFSNDYAKAVFYSGKSSLTTHNNRLAIDACRCFGGMIQQAITGRSKDAILNVDTVDLDLSEKVAEIVSGSYLNKDVDNISSSAFVIDSLEASLWAFYQTDNFKDAVLNVVNLGDDADTVGAITGQIAGAYYGLSNIPEDWVNKLVKKDFMFQLIDRLYVASE